MAENTVRPPEAPKPSGSSTLSTNRLKNRLILGWSRLPATADEAVSGHQQKEPMTMEGFGEGQFDLADKFDSNRSMLGVGSSLWSENTFTKKLHNSSTIAPNHADRHKTFQATLQGHSIASVGSVDSLRGATFMGSTASASKPGKHKAAFVSSQLTHIRPSQDSTHKRQKHKLRDPSRMPHLSVSQLYSQNSGWQDVASSMAVGDTEFCYLQSDAADAYKFAVKNNYPAGRITKNDFVTMSKHGVMRSSVITGESEMVSHEDMLFEHEIYHKLVQIRVFKQFRLWKTFYVWRTTVKRDKYERTTDSLRVSLLLVDPFYRYLVSIVIAHCVQLQDLTVMPLEAVTVYDQKHFIKFQRHAVLAFKTHRDEIMEKLVSILCRLGESHVAEAMQQAPNTIPMSVYNTLKADQHSTHILVTGSATTAGSIFSPLTVGKAANNAAKAGPAVVAGSKTHRHTVHESAPNMRKSSVQTAQSNNNTSHMLGDSTPINHNHDIDYHPTPAAPVSEKVTVSYTEKAAIRTNCRRLALLFRLVDFMVRDAMYNSVHLGFLKLQAMLEGTSVVERKQRRLSMQVFKMGKTDLAPVYGRQSALVTAAENVIVKERSVFRLVVDLAPAADTPDDQNSDTTGPTDTATATVSTIIANIENITVGFANTHHTLDAHLQRVMTHKYHLVLDLTLSQVIRTFTDCATAAMRAAAFHDGILTLNKCINLLSPIINEIQDHPVEDRFAHNDTAVHTIMHSMCDLIGIDYTRCTTHLRQYDYLCETYLTHTRVLETAETTQLHQMPPEVMAELLELFKTSTEKVNDISDVHDIGLFRIEFSALKSKIVDLISSCRKTFHRLIPELYVSHGDILYNELSHLIDVIDSKCVTLEQYVKVVELYNKTIAETELWGGKFAYIMAIRDIITSEPTIPKTDAIERQNVTLVTVWQRYTAVLSQFEDCLEENSKLFQLQLKNKTKQLVEPLDAARAYLQAKEVHDHNTDPDSVLTQLHDYMSQVDMVLQKGKEIEYFQSVLKVNIYQHTDMRNLSAELHTMHTLWSLAKLIKELQQSFMAVNFLDANSSDVEKQLLYVKHMLSTHNNTEKINAVQIWLAETLQHLQFVAPVIKKLQAPTMTATHVARVHSILKRDIFTEEDVTVGELVENVNILQYVTILDQIFEESLFEYNLEFSAKQIHKKLHSYEFVLECEKDNNTLIYATNCTEIGIFLQDALLSLQACNDSKYATPHAALFATQQANLQQWIEFNNHFFTVQSAYLRIRILFTCARTARFLSSSVKHFKILDENWRNVIKAAKQELKICAIFDDPALCECLLIALQAMTNVDHDLRAHIRDQCVKYPRLYLIDTEYLMHVYATLEPAQVLQKCSALFPHLNNVLFLPDDPHTTSAVTSRGEMVIFRKPCSARSSLADWLRAVENGTHDRVEYELREYMLGNKHILEDLKTSRGLEQARLCAVSCGFWTTLLKHLGDVYTTMHLSLRVHLHDINEQIQLYSGLTVNHAVHMDAYHRKSLENLLILLLSQRDLLQYMYDNNIDSSSSDTNFVLECSLKKIWDSESSSLVVKQGQHKRAYGNKYIGFAERLVITPLTDKCFLSITNIVESNSFACIVGNSGAGKLHTTTALAQEWGLDVMTFDCANIRNVSDLVRIVRAHLGSGLWGNYSHLSTLPSELLSVFLTIFSAVHVALANNESCLYLNDHKVDIVDRNIARPRFCLHFQQVTLHPATGGALFPPSVRRQFRIVHFASPDRKAICTVLLTANNFTNVGVTATRLEALCDYLLVHGLCPEGILLKLLVKTIPLAKLNYLHPTAESSQQLAIYAKLLISEVPWALQHHISTDDLRYICNLFLEIIYTPEKDGAEFKRTASVTDCATLLQEQVRKGRALSVIVVGNAGAGKSTLIREVATTAITEFNNDVDKALQVPKYTQNTPVKIERKKALYPHILNLFTMACFVPPSRASSECVSELAPTRHNPIHETHTSVLTQEPTHQSSGMANSVVPENNTTLLNAVETALQQFIYSIDAAGETQILHVDTQSSLQLAYLLPLAEHYTSYYSRPLKFIWECVELNHIEPAVLVKVPCICIKGQVFDAEDVIAFQLKRLGTKYCHPLHELLTKLCDLIIRPCLQQRPRDSLVSESALTENLFKMLESVLVSLDLHIVAASVKLWENSVQRVVLLCCIWSVGVCSNTSRESFENWFYDHFEPELRRNEQKIYPAFDMRSISLYDCALHCPEKKEVYVEWTVFDYGHVVKTIGFGTSVISTEMSPEGKSVYSGSSEERMKRSYHDLYYTTLLSGSANSIVIPTPSAASYMLIQCGLMKTGGSVLISGDPGSGKSTLMRQLLLLSKAVNANKLSHECASRWVCHTTDCGPVALQHHIDSAKKSVLPLLMERKLLEKGCILIDDVSMVQHSDTHTSCAEFLRTSHDTKQMYFCARRIYRTMQRLYTVLSTNNAAGTLNSRFVRHFNILCCEEQELESVFAHKLQLQCNILSEDVAHDVALVTLHLAQECAHILQVSQKDHNLAAMHSIPSSLSSSDKIFLLHTTHRSPAALTDHLLSKISAALISMGGSYSSNDAVRVWDRTACDYFVRHGVYAKMLDTVTDTLANALPFMYASFSSYMDKEKVTRHHGTEALVSSLYGLETISYPLSYKINARGFYDSKGGIYTGITCAESVRDAILKKHSRNVVPKGVSADSLAYWTEVLAICAELSAPRMSGLCSVTLLYNNTPQVHSKVVSVSTLYLYGKYHFLHLDPSVYAQYSTSANSASATLDSVSTESNAVTAASSSSAHDQNKADSFQDALTELFVEAFLLDNIVLRSIKACSSQLNTQHSTIEALLTLTQLAELSHTLPASLHALLVQVCQKYASIDAKTAFTDDSLPPEKSDRRMNVWHLAVSSAFCSTPNSFQFLLDTIELQSEGVLAVLSLLGAHLNPSAHRYMRDIMSEYQSRQKYVLSLCDTSGSAVEEVLYHINSVPHFLASLSVLSCYESYTSSDTELARMVGEECAQKVLVLVDKVTTECRDKLQSSYKTSHATSISSAAYRCDTILSIMSVYRMFEDVNFGTTFRRCLRSFAASCISDAHVLQAISALSLDISNPHKSHHATPRAHQPEEEAHFAFPPDESVPYIEQSVLGDVLRCVLYSRYSNVLHSEGGNFTFSTSNHVDISAAVADLGLPSRLPKEVPLSAITLSLAAAMFLCSSAHTQFTALNNGPSFGILPKLVALAGALPAVSSARDLLTAVCFALASGHSVTLADDSFVSLLSLMDLVPGIPLESIACNTHDVVCTLDPSTHVGGDHSTDTSSAMYRMQTKSVLPSGSTEMPVVILAHSNIVAEFVLLSVISQQRSQQSALAKLFCDFSAPMEKLLTTNATTVDGADSTTVDLSTLASAVPDYAAQWRECVLRVYKSCNTLSCLFQALSCTVTCRGVALLAVYEEFASNLRHAAVSALERRTLRHSTLTVDLNATEYLISQCLQHFLQWLASYLSISEYHQVLFGVLLNLYLYTSHPLGQINAQRVLLALKPVLHDTLGIVPLGDLDGLSDTESETSSSNSDNSEHKALSDTEYDEDANFKLTEVTVATLKQSLLAIAQAMSSTATPPSMYTHSSAAAVPQSSTQRKSVPGATQRKSITAANVNSNTITAEGHSASVVSDIRKNIEEWVLWVLDVKEATLPYKGDYKLNWLDKVAICLCVKPIVVLPTLIAAVESLGMNLPPVSTHTSSSGTGAHFSVTSKPAQASKAMVLFTHGLGAKDVLSELEHGGDSTTMAHFAHVYHAPEKPIVTAVGGKRNPTQVGGNTITTDSMTTRQSMISVQNQQDFAQRVALNLQERDRNMHFFVHENNRAQFSCSPGQLRRFLQSKLSSASSDAPSEQFLSHFVVLPSRVKHLSLQTHNFETLLKQASATSTTVLETTQRSTMWRSSTLCAPQITARPSMHQYVTYLEYCNHIVAAVPMHCPPTVQAIVYRVRWLLVLFHTAVQCKLAGTADDASIGVDALIQALISVDTLLTRAFHNVPKEEFLAAPDRAGSKRNSVENSAANSRRNSSAAHVTTSAGHNSHHNTTSSSSASHAHAHTHSSTSTTSTTASTAVVEKTTENRRSEVHRLNVISWSMEMLVVEVADCLYGSLTPSVATRDTIRAIYHAYFTAGSLNPCAEYLIKGKVVLPTDFSRAPVERFFIEMKALAEEESNYIELSDSTLAEVNSVTLLALHQGIEHVVDVWSNRADSLSHKPLLPVLLNPLVNNLVNAQGLCKVHRALQRMLDRLPSLIDLEETDIAVRMKDHKKNLGRPVGTHPHVPHAPVPLEVSQRRRRAEKIVTTFESREFDPLWAFVLSETLQYNRDISALRRAIESILSTDLSLQQFLLQRGESASADVVMLEKLHSIVTELQDGYVPRHLYTAEVTSSLKIDEWCKEMSEQRDLLHEWLSYGYPGKIKLHLLRNPAGLLYALKETFCMRTDNTLDKVYIDFRVQEVTNIYLPDLLTISKTNFGCSVMLSDLYLHNALYTEKSSLLEFLPDPSASAYGKRLAVVVTVTKDPHEFNPEEYLCPLYVHSLLPVTHDLLGMCTNANSAAQLQKMGVLAYIPMETTEDVEDCKIYNVAVHSGNNLTLPV